MWALGEIKRNKETMTEFVLGVLAVRSHTLSHVQHVRVSVVTEVMAAVTARQCLRCGHSQSQVS